MKGWTRRESNYGAGAFMATALAGCGKQQEQVADAGVTVFVNGTVLPVDAAFSTHEALAISGIRVTETWMDGNRVFPG